MRFTFIFLITNSFEFCACSFYQILPRIYEKSRRPHFAKNVADKCSFDIFVRKIGPISESSMTMTTDIFFRVAWTDPRLNVSWISDTSQFKKGYVNLAGSEADSLWKPNIYFLAAVDESTPDEVSISQFLRVYGNGTVFFSRRVLLQTRCPLDLSLFPLDSQFCSICFESYEYDDSEQLISWRDPDDQILSSEDTATFVIRPLARRTSRTVFWPELDANYTTLCFKVSMQRKVLMYLITMYLPSMALVVLSWISFWIEKNAVPARAGLTITTVLAQITLITGTANKFPSIADLKLGDIYMIVNFFFVFGALIEFAMVTGDSNSRTASKTARIRLRFWNKVVEHTSVATEADLDPVREGPADSCRRMKERYLDVDSVSKRVFPACFVVWNVLYFAIGFSLSRMSEESRHFHPKTAS